MTGIDSIWNLDFIDQLRDMVKHELRVTSCMLRVNCYELKLKSASSNPWVQIHELRLQLYKLRIQIHELRV